MRQKEKMSNSHKETLTSSVKMLVKYFELINKVVMLFAKVFKIVFSAFLLLLLPCFISTKITVSVTKCFKIFPTVFEYNYGHNSFNNNLEGLSF